MGTDLTPICMGVETHCLKRGLQSWLSIVKEPQGNKIHFFLLEAFSSTITGENITMFPPHLPIYLNITMFPPNLPYTQILYYFYKIWNKTLSTMGIM